MVAAGVGDPFGLLVAIGFREDLLSPLRDKLPALLRIVLEPFVEPGTYSVATSRRSERVEDVLGEDRWNFRMSGPPHLIFLLRAMSGLSWYLRKLGVDASWSRPLQPVLRHHATALAAVRVPPADDTKSSFQGIARHLRIHVVKEGRLKVALTFPAMAIDDLGSLMGEDVESRVRAGGVDTQELVRRVRRTGYTPQEVFALPDDGQGREVRVWLE
jgi:hypothetical protein